MTDDYIYCILSKENTINLIKFCNQIRYENADELDFYNRSSTWDDVKLIIPFKYFFEIVDKIELGRIQDMNLDHLMETLSKLENELCAELEMFDESFIKTMINENYIDYKDSYTNLSNSLPYLIKTHINSQHTLIK
jgi:hypothetical protein